MNTAEILRTLCSVYGASGLEDGVGAQFLRMIAPYADKTELDRAKNALAFRGCGEKKLLIEAHSDEVGLIVTKISGGFLSFMPLGGIDVKILPSAHVRIFGRESISGIIGIKPPHLQEKGEDRSLKISDMVIDTGLSDAASVVSVGDIAVLDAPFTLLSGDKVAARCADDRACLAAIVLAASKIKKSPFGIIYAATSGEELHLRGAKALSESLKPDISISLDVTFGESRGAEKDSYPLDAPTLCISPSLSRDLTEGLAKAAADAGVKVNYEVEPGSSGTNAWAVAFGSPSAKTALISVPIRYMHSSVEVCSLKCIEAAAEIVCRFAEGGFGFDK